MRLWEFFGLSMSDLTAASGHSRVIMKKGVAEISDNAPKMDRTSEADPANINFVGLEPQLRDDVHLRVNHHAGW